MDERVIRATLAAREVPRTMAGMMSVSQLVGEYVAGSQPRLMEKFKIKIRPSQKFGMERPNSARSMKT